MFNADKKMDHTKYLQSLRFIVKDAQESVEANPEGPNSGYYQDEVCYAAAEIRRREANGSC